MGRSRVLRLAQGRPGTIHWRVGKFMTLRHQNAPSTPSTRIPKYSVNYFRNPYFHYHLHCLRFSQFPKLAVSNVSGFSFCIRVVAKIPSCRVNAISRRGIVQIGSILLFPIRVAGAHTYTCSIRENPRPRLLVTALLAVFLLCNVS